MDLSFSSHNTLALMDTMLELVRLISSTHLTCPTAMSQSSRFNAEENDLLMRQLLMIIRYALCTVNRL
ncbi:hypothetical protein BS78_03G250700 [Paspalum vaginatum]|nr:hypothetical protein BS78_03G250700 [Paspalum vaginatum]